MKKTLFQTTVFAKRNVIIAVTCGLFVLIFGIAIFQGYKQFHSTLGKGLVSDRTVANMAAIILSEHEKATLGILQSYASRPLFIDNVRRREVAGVQSHLIDLKNNNHTEMDRTFLTDQKGILWANFPVFPEAIGKDLSDRDWYKGTSSKWQPYVSSVFRLIVENKPLAVAVCVPIFDEKGEAIGILANSHRLNFIGDIFQQLQLDSIGKISVIDQEGHIIYSNKGSFTEQIVDYPLYMEVQQGIREKNTDLEVIDPQQGQGRKFLAIASLENLGWSVIVERSWNDTFHSEYSSFAGIAAIATLVFLFITAFINYQYSLHSKAQNLLETERQLRQSETRYKHLLENIPDILYTYSSVHAGIYFSPQVESVLGYNSDYLRNHPALWHDSIHPHDLPEVNRAIENSIAGQRIQLEYRIRDAHGQWHWLYDRSVNIANDVGETLISGLASDISERKQLEEVLRNQSWRLESIIEGTHVGTWEWNVQTGDVILNELWAQMIGFTLAELAPISIKTWATFAHPDDFKQSAELLKKHFAGEFPFYNYECRMKHKDGHWIWVLDRGRVITRTDDGQPLLMFGTHTDITESKKVEEQQRNWEHQRLRIQKVESLKIMAGAIAHHFNNQLGAVIGNLEMALEDLRGDAAPVKILADAMKAARKAAEISEHMLTYLGQTTGIHEPLDLSETCRHSLSLLQATAPKGLILKVELLSPGPTISANSNQIQQVITNLVTNAWEAVADTEGSVFLTVKMASPLEIAAAHRFPADWQPQDEISYACLEVVDTGCGIAEEDINKLFDPFFSTKFSGRGLGLPVVFGIVNAHHGSVIVESEIGRGSTFRVLLPVSAEELPQQLKTIQPLAANGSGTILLVDDEDLLRQMAATRLIRLGYEVIETKNGLEAMEMFRLHQEKICCVLTDLTMPFMDGWEVLAAVRKLSPDMPVILSSGYDEAKVKTIFGDHHELPQAFLHKPYQKAELQSALAKAMGAA